MSSQALHIALLRPAVLHILRAAGFHSMRPSVLDAVVDICARYMLLLADRTAANALNNHNELCPDIMDLRMALQDCNALRPQKSAMEEEWEGREDIRGVEAFIEWATGPENREIRRIAGLARETGPALDVDALDPKEDYLTGKRNFQCCMSNTRAALTSSCNSPEEEAQQDRRRVKIPGNSVRKERYGSTSED